jgi:hypothetical protein
MCISPRLAYKKTNGQYTLTAIGNNAPLEGATPVACGQCMECRIKKSREWSTRMILESKMHTQNCFITLTYNDENRPPNKSLTKEHIVKFLKKYRKSIEPLKLRFYATGEYGETTQREHYHACIFGHKPTDLVAYKRNKQGDMLYRSPSLEKLWKYGYVSVGEFNSTTAEYCAKYVTKAILGLDAEDAYSYVEESTGEIIKREPPYQTMSSKPGLGATFYKKYKTDLYPQDQVIIDGKPRNIPEYFDGLLKKEDPELLQRLKAKRNELGTKWTNRNQHTQTRQGMVAKKTILNQKLYNKKRDYS